MSIQNDKTVSAYEQAAKKYLENTIQHDKMNPAHAKQKQQELAQNIQTSFNGLPSDARILEVGSADGENAKIIQDLGYDVIASDVADDFIAACKKQNLPTIKFNVLKDQFPNDLSGIFCWRVFVHFTKDDILNALNRAYDALLPGGRIVFNIIDQSTHDCTEEMKDFSDEYRMGVERFYAYYTKEGIENIINQTKFKIFTDWYEKGGHNNWFCFVLEK